MPKVSYTVSFGDEASKPNEWTVSRGQAPSGEMQIVIVSDDLAHTETLDPGNYEIQISIRGTDDASATLTISRPKFKDKIVNVSIASGLGQGIATSVFRVV